MDSEEIWKSVVGYEGTYEISTARQVASLPRKGRPRGGILKQWPDRSGRPCVTLCLRGKQTAHYVAHLVAYAFLPPKKPTDQVVRHLNDDPTDNRVENLAWGTHKDNAQDSIRNETCARGMTHGMAKLTEDDVREIRRLYATGQFTQQDLALRFGVSYQTISDIVRRHTWKHIM